MYTLINNNTKIVLHTGLTRTEMDRIKTDSMSFYFEPDHETQPVANITKYDKETHDFIYLTWDEVKEYRTRLLEESDWRMVTDYPGADREDWKKYRQALRDIPQDYKKVKNVTFPTKP